MQIRPWTPRLVNRLRAHPCGTQPPVRRAQHTGVALKHGWERQAPDDGTRVLVDRWPSGLRGDQLAVDYWLKELAPSDRLRQWYGGRTSRWVAFAERYRAEVARQEVLLNLLDELRCRGPVTLVYTERDPVHNNAVVLRSVLEERRRAQERRDSAAMRVGKSGRRLAGARRSQPRRNTGERQGRRTAGRDAATPEQVLEHLLEVTRVAFHIEREPPAEHRHPKR